MIRKWTHEYKSLHKEKVIMIYLQVVNNQLSKTKQETDSSQYCLFINVISFK